MVALNKDKLKIKWSIIRGIGFCFILASLVFNLTGSVKAFPPSSSTLRIGAVIDPAEETGLVGLWHMDEASGTIVDSSGNGNDGTYNGALYSQAGEYGTALGFTGGTNNVNIPSDASLDLTSSISVSMWVYKTTSDTVHLISKRVSDGAWYLSTVGNRVSWVIVIGDSQKQLAQDTVGGISLNEWHHIVGTYDGSDMTIYIDGVADGTQAQTGNIDVTVDPVRIGWGYSDAYSWDGNIDEVAIYNRALDASEVAVLAADAPVEITNCTELQNIQNDVTGDYVLANDIDCSATSGWNGGAGFVPIADSGTKFSGTLNGQGYTVSDLYINTPGTDSAGLFRYIDATAEITNIGLIDVDITGKIYVGALVCDNWGGTISNSYSTGDVFGTHHTGGLVGVNRMGLIDESYSSVNVQISNDYIGGLVGYNAVAGTISNSYANGTVVGGNHVGGLVGLLSGNVINSYSTGSVSGAIYIGGLVGFKDTGTSTASYWDTETSGQLTSVEGTGKTTAEMMQQATFTGWDFSTIWEICEGVAYSRLAWENFTCPVAEPLVLDMTFDSQDVTDSSTYSNDGTNNGATFVESPLNGGGYAASFGGANEFINVPTDSSLNFGEGSFTLSSWIKTDTTSYFSIFDKGDIGTPREMYSLFLNSGAGNLRSILGNGVTAVDVETLSPQSGSDYRDGEWHNIVMVYDSTKLIGYVDGASTGEYAYTAGTGNPPEDLFIGKIWTTTGAGFIDEVQMYNTALTAEEINQNYEDTKPAEVGALSSTNVEPASLVAGATPTQAISFTTINPIENLGKIVVTYPAGFDVSGADALTAGALSGLDGTWTASVASQVVTFTQTSGGITAAGAKSFTIAGIKNPVVTGEAGTYTILTTTSGDVDIDTDAAVTSDTFTVGALSSTNVEPVSLVVGATPTQTISFTTVNPIANLGKIVVTYPAGFDVSGADALTAGALSGLDGTWTASVAAQVVTFTQTSGGITAAGAKSFTITGMKNPVVTGAAGTYTILTTTSGDVDIDTDAAVTSDTFTTGVLAATNVEPDSLVVDTISIHTISFTTVNSIENLGKIVVTYPSGFDVSGADALTAGELFRLDGTWTASVSGQVVTFTQTGGGITAAGSKSFTIAGIKNPTATGDAGTYTILTTTSGDVNIDTDAAVATDTFAAERNIKAETTPLNVDITIGSPSCFSSDGESDVTVTLDGTNITSYLLSTDKYFSGSDWQTFTGAPMEVDWTFESSGSQTLYVLFKSSQNNISERYSDTVTVVDCAVVVGEESEEEEEVEIEAPVIVTETQTLEVGSEVEFDSQTVTVNSIDVEAGVVSVTLESLLDLAVEIEASRLSVQSGPMDLNLVVGVPQQVDTDGDGIADVEVLLEEIISASEIKLSVTALIEETVEEEAEASCVIPESFPYSPGVVLKSPVSPKVYFFAGSGCRHWILNEETLFEYVKSWTDVIVVEESLLSQLTEGSSLSPTGEVRYAIPDGFPYQPGDVLKTEDSSKVYLFHKSGTKRWILSEDALFNYVDSWAEVEIVNPNILNMLPEGKQIDASFIANFVNTVKSATVNLLKSVF